MKQSKRFHNPVYKADQTNRVIEVGDTVKFVLLDNSTQDETVTGVENNGRKISWDNTVNQTRQGDVKAVDISHNKSCAQYGGSQSPHAGGDPVEWPA